LRLAGGKEISFTVAVKMAVSFFNGWVNEDFNGSFDTLPFPLLGSKINPLIIHTVGIRLSLGGTILPGVSNILYRN
jgi:hypothetical protein